MGEITMDLRLVFKIPDSGLRINGLIQGLKESSSEIHETILATLMKALEERVIERLLQKDPERYGRNGHQSKSRHLKCSLGTIAYRFAQVVDRQKDRTFTPLAEALSIPAYEHYLDDALEPPIGLSIHVSYRRATSEIERIQGQCMSPTTVHSRLQKFAHEHNPFGDLKEVPFQFLLVDGTKVHLQGPLGKDLGKVEMRWALASLGSESRFEPVGFWIDTDWAQIRKDLQRRLNYKKLKILFSDGGPGIQENLLLKGMDHQRCLWHGKREFPYLLYADGAKKTKQAPFLDQLQSIPIMNFSKSQMERLRPEDRPLVEQISKQTQQGFFYPKDSTPGCTTEAQQFRDLYDKFRKAGCEIVGISRDSIKSHETFKSRFTLPFALLSDAEEKVCTQFAVMKQKTMYGKDVRGIERSTFVLDSTGIIRKEWRGLNADGHAEEVLAFVQTS